MDRESKIKKPKLINFRSRVYSQWGEDGIIEKIFEIIGTKSKVSIEFGAWDGFFLSNTANLWTKNWQGILIESNDISFRELQKKTEPYDCICIKAWVGSKGTNTLESILHNHNQKLIVDLLSIDVDGDDYYIFKSLKKLKPRLIICEYNPTIPPHIDLVQNPGENFGCSAMSLIRLADKKGYIPVSLTETNCFFVEKKYKSLFKSYNIRYPDIFVSSHLTYLITGYKGDYLLSQAPPYGFSYPTRARLKGNYVTLPMPSLSKIFKNYILMMLNHYPYIEQILVAILSRLKIKYLILKGVHPDFGVKISR